MFPTTTALSCATAGPQNLSLNGERSVAFPMISPYSPVVKARIPVPGLNRFPGQANRLGKKYYGLAGVRGGSTVFSSPVESDLELFRGLDGLRDNTFDSYNFQYPSNPRDFDLARPQSASGQSTLQSILNAIQNTLPSTISAIKGKPYYDTSTGQQATVNGAPINYATGQTGANAGATAGAAVGNLGDALGSIVTQNPLITLLVVGGVVLLFMKPPSRGR